MSLQQPPTPLRPIILGGDIGSYASARAFHEAYGVTTVIISGTKLGAVADSRIVDLRVEPDLANRFVDVLRAVMSEEPAAAHILLGSVDWWVDTLVAHRTELEPAIVPYAPAELISRVTNKARFAQMCEELDIPHPRTVVVRPREALPEKLPRPMVVKVADPGAFRDVEFAGKNKVEFFDTRQELQGYLATVADAGYMGEFVVQEYIPGDDDAMAAVNAFYGPDGRAHFFVFGQVLLEEHTPNGLGNSVAQITGSREDHPAVVGARRLLDHLGWVGFANLDLKASPRGHLFLELNPRVGRSGYAVTAAGHNVARAYVDAFIRRKGGPDAPRVVPPAHLFTVVPTRLVGRYAPKWRRQIRELRRSGAVTNPYYYRSEKNPRRWFYIIVAMINQYRKFARHHPSRTGKRATP